MSKTDKAGWTAVIVGALDWFARYETVKEGITYLAGQKVAVVASYSWLSPVLLIIGFTLLLNSKRNDTKEPEVSLPPIDNRAMLTASPHIEHHVHIGDSKKSEVSLPPKATQLKTKPNLIYVNHRTTNLRTGAKGDGFYEDGAEQSDNTLGTLVCFRNEHFLGSDWRTGYASYVRACISFYDNQGKEIGEGVSDVCWLGDLRTINFSVGDSNCVVPILVMKGSKELFCPFIREVHSDWGLGLDSDAYKLPQTPKTLRINLFTGDDLSVSVLLDFAFENSRPTLKRRL